MFQIANKQKGLALPIAIIVMVILSSLGAGLVVLTQNTSHKTSLDLLNVKSYSAAKTGLEYGLYKANKDSSCSTTLEEIVLTEGFKTSFKCDTIVQNEGGTNITFHKITSYGCHTSGSCPAVGTPSAEYTEKMLVSLMAK